MMSSPFFTKHALEKFEILKLRGVEISKAEVLECIADPDDVDDESRKPFVFATKRFEGGRCLRVLYKIVDGVIVIITFYPIKSCSHL